MKNLIRNIFFLILFSIGFSSCIYDKYPDGEESLIDPNSTILFLDLRALNPSKFTTPVEKIKSVRVIIIGKEANQEETDTDDSDNAGGTPAPKGIVECNRFYQFPITDALNFDYTLTWQSTLGTKSIYVIANEESIAGDISGTLDGYVETESAGDLEQWLADYKFNPEYTAEGDAIYLPYSYSKTDFVPVAGKVNPVNCWLIPVATKFMFYFENYRENQVNIDGISMAYTNSMNYLLAHLGPDEITKPYDGEDLYWVDWLAKVSEESWNNPGFSQNEFFNKQVGWIQDYYVPVPGDSHEYVFFKNDGSELIKVKEGTKESDDPKAEIDPGTFTSKIFYIPESVNYRVPGTDSEPEAADNDEESEDQGQTFYLTMKIEDTGDNSSPPFVDVPVPNLGALFRNTYVVISMSFKEGEIEVYAEIGPWNEKQANGWVSEGNAPGNNPFTIKKKW